MSGSEALWDMLALQTVDENVFLGSPAREDHIRSFGGQIVAQSLLAAVATVSPERRVHSLSGHFLRPGMPELGLTCSVERVRDGRSFSVRRVDAAQLGHTAFSLTASFKKPEKGPRHGATMPVVPPPESLDPFEKRFAGRQDTDMQRWFVRTEPFDIRYIGATAFETVPDRTDHRSRMWVRTRDAVPEKSGFSEGALAYISDMAILDPILLQHGMRWTDRAVLGASLDHSIWFHRPFVADEWMLFDQWSPVAFDGVGLAHGEVWTARGELLASVVQQALLRPPGPSHPA